ncbi:hypothetical protein BDZ97DRAFT_225026 [Flammula alnicola]|nr:hypothetical protein BDZ97DRAFT_225026 [Flammula alnicola]
MANPRIQLTAVVNRQSSSVEGATPIEKLNVDLLWHIFTMNADMDAPIDSNIPYNARSGTRRVAFSPLTVTWRSSQVCRFWRDIILGSPSLWGRVVDLGVLKYMDEEWREEMLCRTGTAFLCIKFLDCDESAFTKFDVEFAAFLASLLENEWPRINKLNITIPVPIDDPVKDVIRRATQRPAPHLQSFRLHCYSLNYSQRQPPLFSDDAPSLREFHGINFNLQSPWLRNIRIIELSFPSTFSDVLSVLKQMPFLTTLVLHHDIPPLKNTEISSAQIYLPHLATITISHDIRTCVAFLNTLIPPPGCKLFLRTPRWSTRPLEPVPDITHAELPAVQTVLSRYLHAYFEAAKNSEQLSLDVTRTSLILCVYSHSNHSSSSPSSQDFDIAIHSQEAQDATFISFFLRSLSHCRLTSIKMLDLSIHPCSLDPSCTSFIQFLLAFGAVEVLRPSLYALQTIKNLQVHAPIKSIPPNNILFPQLRTIRFRHVREGIATNDSVLAFLSWRRDIGLPIQVVDFITSPWNPRPCDMRRLFSAAEMAGVMVWWKEGEMKRQFLCGSVKKRIKEKGKSETRR